jgi:hypothetical protein
LSLRKKIKKTE